MKYKGLKLIFKTLPTIKYLFVRYGNLLVVYFGSEITEKEKSTLLHEAIKKTRNQS
ncbi:MAG: hypothetical protein Q8936_16690 [Bacillota bacterium]|nr:hypothetical protein [Bacillota bacterium]